VLGPALNGAGEQDWRVDRLPDPAYESDRVADLAYQPDAEQAWQGGSGQPDPRSGGAPRVWTLLALLVGVLGVAAVWPLVAIGVVAAWSWGARFTDRSITSVVMRRQEHGRRRRDVPLAIVASPWHGVVSALAMVLTMLIPAVVAIGSTFFIALAVATVAGGEPAPASSLPLVAGGLLGLLMSWWGVGGASLRRGSRSLVRAVAPGRATTDFVVATLVLMGAGLAAWAWVRHGQLDWWPWSSGRFPVIPRVLW